MASSRSSHFMVCRSSVWKTLESKSYEIASPKEKPLQIHFWQRNKNAFIGFFQLSVIFTKKKASSLDEDV